MTTVSRKFAKEQRLYLILLSMLLGVVMTSAIVVFLGFESSGVLQFGIWQMAAIYMAASVAAGILLAWKDFYGKPSGN